MDEITMVRCIERMTEAFGILKRKVENLENELDKIRNANNGTEKKVCKMKILPGNISKDTDYGKEK